MCTIKAILLQEWFVGGNSVTPLVWCQQSEYWIHWIQWKAGNGMFTLLLGRCQRRLQSLNVEHPQRPVLPATQTLCPVYPKTHDGRHAPKPSQGSLRVRHAGGRNFFWRWGSEQRVFVLSVTPLSTCSPSCHACQLSLPWKIELGIWRSFTSREVVQEQILSSGGTFSLLQVYET